MPWLKKGVLKREDLVSPLREECIDVTLAGPDQAGLGMEMTILTEY